MAHKILPIKNFEGIYSVSSNGDIIRDKTGQSLAPRISTNPKRGQRYASVALYKRVNGKITRFQFLIATIVARAFIGPKPKGLQVNHKDGNRLNNRAFNLEYLTQSENIKHAIRVGLIPPREGIKGSANNLSKLTERQVKKIRKDYENEKETFSSIAKRYNICQQTVGNIIYRKSWRHI